MSDFEFTYDGAGNVQIGGSLVFATVRDALQQSAVVFTSPSAVAIDLSRVKNADSAGLALLIEWYRLAEKNKRSLRFIGTPEQLRALAKISDLDTLLPFV